MQRYGVREVEKLLRLPRSTIRSLIDAGFVSPVRGPRRAWLFSFQDLVVMRAAQALAKARVPRRRILRSMRELRQVMKQGGRRWQAESGQYLLDFDGDAAGGVPRVIERKASAQGWFDRAAKLEGRDAQAAIRAYEQAIATAPAFVEAHINLGRLLHESGQLARAERAYRDGVAACGDEALLHYNLGVLLEDLRRKADAMRAYEDALRSDPRLADCHYNLALLCDRLGRPRDAIRHMAQYRKLVR